MPLNNVTIVFDPSIIVFIQCVKSVKIQHDNWKF